jgi:hypothetical protein
LSRGNYETQLECGIIVREFKSKMIERINELIAELGWEPTDEIVVQVGGVAATGTKTVASSNPKWSKPYGSVTYQKDAFIVIKNESRSPVVPSQPNNEQV